MYMIYRLAKADIKLVAKNQCINSCVKFIAL